MADLPSTKSLMKVRRTLLESFIAELLSVGLLDRFQLAGVIVRWWNTNQYDLRTLVAHGFTGVVDGWVTTITTAMEDSDTKADPLDHRLVPELLPSYLEELAASKPAGPNSTPRSSLPLPQVTRRTRNPPTMMRRCRRLNSLPSRRSWPGSRSSRKPCSRSSSPTWQSPRRTHRGPGTRPRPPPGQERPGSPPGRLRHRHRQQIIAALENWWDKYAVPLHQIEGERAASASELSGFLKDLGYE